MSNTHRCCNPGFRSSRLSQAIQGILLASVLTASVAAHAEDSNDNPSRKSYHISGGTLGHALRQFASYILRNLATHPQRQTRSYQ